MCNLNTYVNWADVPSGGSTWVYFPGSYYVTSVSFNADVDSARSIVVTGWQRSSPAGEFVFLFNAASYDTHISGFGQILYKC